MEHHHQQFELGDRLSYKGKTGTVTRINILGLTPCCAVQVDWDDTNKRQILQSKELKECTKL